MDATTRRDARTLLALLALILTLVLALAYGVGTGNAAPTPTTAPFPAVAPTKDPLNSDWFRDACSDPAQAKAGCGVQVVSNASEAPLASASPPAT